MALSNGYQLLVQVLAAWICYLLTMNLMLETKSPQIINVIYLRHQLLKKICNIRLDLVNKYTVFQVQVNADSKQKFLTLSYFYY